MRQIAVTGATGFIGYRLAARLARQGQSVRGLVRPGSTRALPDGVTRVVTSLETRALATALTGVDTVVHLAGITRARTVQEFRAVNVDATRQVAEAARECGALLVHVSSQAAAGVGTAARPTTEQDRPAPITPYGASKLAGEDIVRDIPSLRWTILRPASVYGPGDRAFLTLFRLAARGVFPILGSGGSAYTLIHVDDIVRAIEIAAGTETAGGETFFVGHPEPVTADDLRAALGAAAGSAPRTLRLPSPLTWIVAGVGELGRRLGWPAVLDLTRRRELTAPGFVCNVDKARDRLGFEARIGLTEGFAATARWYRQQGWLRGEK